MRWGAYGAGVAVVIAAAVLGAISAKIAGGALQFAGIVLAGLGVAVVRSWLERAAEAAVERKHGLDRLWAQSRWRLRLWWARVHKRSIFVEKRGSDTASVTETSKVDKSRPPVDRATVSDRDWLIRLDDDVEAMFHLLNQLDERQIAEHNESQQRLAAQRDELRAEMLAATRQGWELIVGGLVCSAVGTALGMAA